MNSKKILLLVFFSAFFLRFSNIFNQLYRNQILFFTGDSDPYCHILRVQSAIQNFPRLTGFEPFLNFPYGTHHFWPPVFDWLIAFLCLILGLGFPSVKLVEWTCAVLPPLIGGLTILPVYHFSKNILSEKNSLLTAVIFSLMPFHILYTTFARFDHHLAEPFLYILIILFFILACQKHILYAFLAGVTIFLAIGTWIGSTIFVLILGISIILQFICDTIRKQCSTRIFYSAVITFATALPGVMLLRNPYWKKVYPVSFDTISLLQPYTIWFFLVLFLVFYFIQGYLVFPKSRRILFAAGIFAFFLISSTLILSGGFIGGILAGINFLSNRPPQFFKDFGEFEPFITNSSGFLEYIFVGIIIFVVFYGLILFINEIIINPKIYKIVFLVSTVIFGILTLIRPRFSGIFSINLAILVAYIFERLFQNKISQKGSKLLIVIPGILVFSFYSYGIHKITKKGGDDFKVYYQALLWLKENSENISRSNLKYGVLPSASEYGNAIVYVAKRPTIATNMHLEPQGLITLEKFFLETDISKAQKILADNKVGYIILSRTPYIEQKAKNGSIYNLLWQRQKEKCKQMLTLVYTSASGNIKIFSVLFFQNKE
ncbi:MAG: STT3 domain-containing protein [Elusimicrobiota bacterium]